MSPEGLLVLGQLLKAAGLAGSGGEAKHLVQSGSVRVNGEVEVRRGRRLQPGDLVTASGRTVRVVERFPLDKPIDLVLGSTEHTGAWGQLRRCRLLRPFSGPAGSRRDFCVASLEPPVLEDGEAIGRVILAPHADSDRVWPPSRLPLSVFVYRASEPDPSPARAGKAQELEMLARCDLYEDMDSARAATAR